VPRAVELGLRHADWVARTLDDLDERRWTEVAGQLLDVVTELLPEIRAAHGWAVELAQALAREADWDDMLTARLHLAAGFVQWPQDQVLGRGHFTRAADLFRGLGHDRHLAHAHALNSVTYVGDDASYDLAVSLSQEATSCRPTG